MLDRIYEEIKLCFLCADLKHDEDIKQTLDWQSAKILIAAYNSLVRLYYKPEYVNESLLGNVVKEYCRYKEEL
jgi:hypothetical protein